MQNLGLILLLLLISASALAQDGDGQPDFSTVEAIINDRIASRKIPSISIAVVRDGKILWEESFGLADKEGQRKATINTPYYLASVSKTITATAIMKLSEQRKINLDSPVNKYLKGGKVSSPSPMWDSNEATVSRVMSHTSGITTFNFWCKGDAQTCAAKDDTIFNRYAVIVSKPGGSFDYSNLGYGILDHVIQNVSGKSFADYMDQEIFKPLGMTNSYVAKDPPRSERAIRYSAGDQSPFEFQYSHSYLNGASMIYGSVHDLAQFAMLHLDELKKKQAIISERSIKAMQDTVARDGSWHYGLGWWINNDLFGYKGILAQGGTFFAMARIQLIPSEGIGIVLLSNNGDYEPSRPIINEVLSILLPTFKKNLAAAVPDKKEAPTAATPEPPAAEWTGYVRTYKGDLPLTFHFGGTKGSTADVGSAKNIAIPEVRIQPNRFSFRVEGDLGLDDTGKGPYNLNFYLDKAGDVLYGSVQTGATVHPDTPQLSYWVEMKQAK